MKSKVFKLVTLIVLLTAGGFSCTKDLDDSEDYRYQWDGSKQQEEFRPINAGTKSSSFTIDSNILSFAVPYLIGTGASEYLPTPGYGSPEGLSSHFWTLLLVMAKGTDVTKLAPTITLAPGATITWIHTSKEQVPSMQVDYTGIAKIGLYDYKHQVDFVVRAPDGSTVTYKFLAVAIGDILPCGNCP